MLIFDAVQGHQNTIVTCLKFQDPSTIEGALPGMVMLMSWIPSLVAVLGAIVIFLYPLTNSKMDEITSDLAKRRSAELSTN